ncbi:MAG: hypothetical protein H6563_01170 [Lewinellaceae bacterium]|nr:hypothetical protein [Lewinellaceae bacterium]
MEPRFFKFKLYLTCFLFFFYSHFVSGQLTLYAEISEIGADTTVVDIVAKDFTDILSLQFSFLYNTDKLSYLVGWTYLPGFSGIDGNPSLGAILLGWIDPDLVGGESLPDCTRIFSLVFKGSGAIAEDFEFSDSPVPIEFIDINGLLNPNFSFDLCIPDTINQVICFKPSSAELRVFPNPIISEFQLEIEGFPQEIFELRLFDILGQEVCRHTFSGTGATFSRGDILPGAYQCAVFQKGNLLTTRMIQFR